ncbi:unnamed protein product, partial [Auanema sp. JU1783]
MVHRPTDTGQGIEVSLVCWGLYYKTKKINMQRFTEELNNLTTQARVLEIDIQRAKLLTEERTTIPEDGSMMRRRLSRVTKCSNTLQDSLKATARAEAGIIEILNILATDEQETIANALKAEKERLQLDQLATSGST